METLRVLLTNLLPVLTVVGVLLAAYIVLLWAASVLWTYRDIRGRSEDVIVQVLAVAMALVLPFAGIALHLILRPRQTLAERYERELEAQYLRRDLEDGHSCPQCQRAVEPDFILCPHCHTALRRRCGACEKVIDLTWSVCPFCGDDGTNPPVRPAYRRPRETEQIGLYDR